MYKSSKEAVEKNFSTGIDVIHIAAKEHFSTGIALERRGTRSVKPPRAVAVALERRRWRGGGHRHSAALERLH